MEEPQLIAGTKRSPIQEFQSPHAALSSPFCILIPPKMAFQYSALIVFTLVLAGVGFLFNWHIIGFRNEFTLLPVKLFDLSTDSSIPTWVSSLILLSCTAPLLTIWKYESVLKEKNRLYWLGLAIMFCVFSVDEVARIHEQIGSLITNTFLGQTKGLFYYSWVIPGAILVISIGLIYLKFIFRLPPRTRLLFIVSGILFVGGGLFIEMLNGQYSEVHGSWNMRYAIGTGLEEFLEMMGTILFLYATLDYLSRQYGIIQISIKSNPISA